MHVWNNLENAFLITSKHNNQQQSIVGENIGQGGCVDHYPHPQTLFAVSKRTNSKINITNMFLCQHLELFQESSNCNRKHS